MSRVNRVQSVKTRYCTLVNQALAFLKGLVQEKRQSPNKDKYPIQSDFEELKFLLQYVTSMHHKSSIHPSWLKTITMDISPSNLEFCIVCFFV